MEIVKWLFRAVIIGIGIFLIALPIYLRTQAKAAEAEELKVGEIVHLATYDFPEANARAVVYYRDGVSDAAVKVWRRNHQEVQSGRATGRVTTYLIYPDKLSAPATIATVEDIEVFYKIAPEGSFRIYPKWHSE